MLIVWHLSHSWGLGFRRVDFTTGLPRIISTTNGAAKFLQSFLNGVQPLHVFGTATPVVAGWSLERIAGNDSG